MYTQNEKGTYRGIAYMDYGEIQVILCCIFDPQASNSTPTNGAPMSINTLTDHINDHFSGYTSSNKTVTISTQYDGYGQDSLYFYGIGKLY